MVWICLGLVPGASCDWASMGLLCLFGIGLLAVFLFGLLPGILAFFQIISFVWKDPRKKE